MAPGGEPRNLTIKTKPDWNGTQTTLVEAAVIRDVTRGIVPQRQRVNGTVPFNLRSEKMGEPWRIALQHSQCGS